MVHRESGTEDSETGERWDEKEREGKNERETIGTRADCQLSD